MTENEPLYTQERLTQVETMALEYPNVTPEDFARACIVSVDIKNKIKKLIKIEEKTVSVVPDGEVLLAGALKAVPTYTLEMLDENGEIKTLKDRMALVAFGSNSSPDVLFDKLARQAHEIRRHFNAASENRFLTEDVQDICVLPAILPDHAVVYGAFLGVRGSIPATIHRISGAVSLVTVGFYSKEAAEYITGTEPNYVGLAMTQKIMLSNGMEISHPVAYISPWGALEDPANSGVPIALATIPSTTHLRKMGASDMIAMVARICDGADLETEAEKRAFIRSNIYNGEKGRLNEKRRLARIEKLQRQHRLPPNVRGEPIFKCSILNSNPAAAEILKASRNADEVTERDSVRTGTSMDFRQ